MNAPTATDSNIDPGTGPRPAVGVGAVVRRGRQLLLIRRANAHGAGTWATPGGHLDHGEDPARCACRELREETGLDVDTAAFLAATNDVHPDGRHYVTLFFLVDYDGPPDTTPDPREVAEARWFEPDDLPTPLFLPLQRLVAGDSYPADAYAALRGQPVDHARPRPSSSPAVCHGVIPVGGLGSRLFPLTLAVPKALLPLRGEPLLHHGLRDLAAGGVRTATVLAASSVSRAVVDHVRALRSAARRGGEPWLSADNPLATMEVDVVEAAWPSSLAGALVAAATQIEWPAVVALPDEVFSQGGRLVRTMVAANERFGGPVGVVVGGRQTGRRVVRLRNLARPPREQLSTAGSASRPGGIRLAGRYVVTRPFVDGLVVGDDPDGSASFVRGLARVAEDRGLVVVRHDRPYWDIGDREGYRRAVAAFDGQPAP